MNFRKIGRVFLVGILLSTLSCREDFETNTPSQDLIFSEQEVFLNTAFTDIPSSTYTLKVSNNENEDVLIPSISLEKGATSFYSIEVDGNINDSKEYEDVLIREGDFITLFITITAKDAKNPLYEDAIVFNLGNKTQTVKLSSTIEEVELFKPDVNKTHYEIAKETLWDNTTSKIIYGGVTIKSGAKLTIEKGTKVYFYTDSELLVEEEAELVVNGTKEEKVYFSGYRTEPEYDSIIGTWNKIGFEENSIAKINYANIRGGTTAIEAIKANLELTNTQILNSEQFGIYSEGSTIDASNVIVNQASRYSVFLNEGGVYTFKHCTVVNYWPFRSNEENALYISNVKSQSGELTYGSLKVDFGNNIIYSEASDGLRLFIDEQVSAVLNFDSNLINEVSGDIDFTSDIFVNTLINKDPLLVNPRLFSLSDLSLMPTSLAINEGDRSIGVSVPNDIVEVSRTVSPDLGAYEYQ